jgi:26S proteasome regulatory subunit N5
VLCPAYSTPEGAGSDYLTLRATVATDPHLQDLPDHNELLQVFITEEILGMDALLKRVSEELHTESSIFGGDDGRARLDHFRQRVCEHNILVVSHFYSRLKMPRLATLLSMSQSDTEEQLSDLVVKGALAAKIDRPAGLVRFEVARESSQARIYRSSAKY